MPTERRPNLFIVGAQKSGTTSLALTLAMHPGIFMASPKEPGYLAFGERGYVFPDGYGRPAGAASWVVRSQTEYLRLFDKAPARCRYLGEASTWYLSEPGMADRLHDFNPSARILVILRQPVDRAHSAWCHARRDGEEPLADFASALVAESGRNQPSHLLRYREMSHYVEPLRDYFRVFGRDRLLVLLHDDLRDCPAEVWRRCCEFLDLDPAAHDPVPAHHNRSGTPRSRLVHTLLHSQRVKDAARRLLPLSLAARIKQKLESANLRPPPTLDPQMRERMTEEFAAEIRELATLIDRDLDHWM